MQSPAGVMTGRGDCEISAEHLKEILSKCKCAGRYFSTCWLLANILRPTPEEKRQLSSQAPW
ncbi:hypothetical protein PSI22_08410 [Xenorhabdus sp. XENO-7]|uniref:Uncharacterized protein n=1 Tax=Xenorhabdus aichiensis TaxID=3025874 RepID=A0ABT5M5V1_9GAMM|nr:hypothetical protein [Xenorhabdus aichiensis]MDC9621656.1 hypothetical protein [Xenorhabdus aichiensis]